MWTGVRVRGCFGISETAAIGLQEGVRAGVGAPRGEGIVQEWYVIRIIIAARSGGRRVRSFDRGVM